MSEEYSAEDFKYLRTGYIAGERNADVLVKFMTGLLEGDGILPPRWRWIDHDYFTEKYGDLGTLLWSKAASYHMMMYNGHHILRLWTDSANTCVLDLCEPLAVTLHSAIPVEDIPESCYRKCKPFKKRTRVSTEGELRRVLEQARTIYGLTEYWSE